MGEFYTTKIWLEDREIDMLESHDFTEEIWESEIPEDRRWILTDLCIKGFLYKVYFKDRDESYYTDTCNYMQHFNKKKYEQDKV